MNPGVCSISPEGLKEFLELYKDEYDVELTPEEAIAKALPILNIVKGLLQ